MIRVLVVEDQVLVRDAISALINLDPCIDVIAKVSNGVEAQELLRKESFDLVLTDIEMPQMSGIELAQFIQLEYPHISTVIMTTFSRAGYIRRALDANVKGFVLKEAPSEELIQAIKQVMKGKKVIDTELALNALSEQDPLSEKERKALALASEGLKTQEIATKLYLSEGTVRNYLSEAISKLGAANRVDAARIAKIKGWL
ncbi:response regulator transcription factor [Pseudoalteromonas sp. T1lg65]|uniref:response regulator transcription factor n=1 Tax=Pseudoalteromonas sp. T1lg65 TaxID=2077101 RepID=UPI003F7A51CF